MKAEASITGKRQITIPKDIYTLLGLSNTDKLVFEQNENNEMVVKKKEISTYEICPVCEREVLGEDTMVVEKHQRYHMSCWNLKDGSKDFKDDRNIVANKLTESQVNTLGKVLDVKKKYALEMIKDIRDNEVIITVPVKITFMQNKPGVIGAVEGYESKKILSCNPITPTPEETLE